MKVDPVILSGKHVRLEPLTEEHIPALAVAGQDPSIWEFMPYGPVITPELMREWVMHILAGKEAGTDQPFAVVHLPSGQIVGSTRYMDIRPAHRGLEIGGTWYAPVFQRTGVNTEAKYLLLRHAFETLGCIRVQLKTDLRNQRSQNAIRRIGAVREGVLRNQMILPNGTYRSSVYFSILDSEWPAVKTHLEELLVR
jgi:RimJ/RimL family protein N-acetyltransferase